MSLNTATFSSDDGTGVVFYDSVTMYVYPVMFDTEEAAWLFADWLFEETGIPVNGQDRDNLYTWRERYYDTVLRDDTQTIGASPYRWVKVDGEWQVKRV